ncbi:MAG: hypothetical protein AAGF12_03440 [Myxococcota bacterium]
MAALSLRMIGILLLVCAGCGPGVGGILERSRETHSAPENFILTYDDASDRWGGDRIRLTGAGHLSVWHYGPQVQPGGPDGRSSGARPQARTAEDEVTRRASAEGSRDGSNPGEASAADVQENPPTNGSSAPGRRERTLSPAAVQSVLDLLVEVEAWRQRDRDEPDRADRSKARLTIAAGSERSEVWEWSNDLESNRRLILVKRRLLEFAATGAGGR